MKTIGSVFISGVKEISTEPALYDNLLEYEGKYYKIGGERFEVKETKVTDENYYLLTLAAMADKMPKTNRKQIVVDIGSWTIDIMPIKNCLPDESLCDTIDEGLITCIGNINNQCVRQLSGKIDESDIIQIMMDERVI